MGQKIVADSGPLGHVLWCCGSKSQDFFTFIQIGSCHTVVRDSQELRTQTFSWMFRIIHNRFYHRDTFTTAWQIFWPSTTISTNFSLDMYLHGHFILTVSLWNWINYFNIQFYALIYSSTFLAATTGGDFTVINHLPIDIWALVVLGILMLRSFRLELSQLYSNSYS